jgi:hypothetical protein
MPSENWPTRWRATEASPTKSSISLTRRRGILLARASINRWAYAVRPGWIAFASSNAPTSCRGHARSWYRLPATVTVPALGVSSPIIRRIVVDFPAPFGPRKPVT